MGLFGKDAGEVQISSGPEFRDTSKYFVIGLVLVAALAIGG